MLNLQPLNKIQTRLEKVLVISKVVLEGRDGQLIS
jgi:hypothetical protein